MYFCGMKQNSSMKQNKTKWTVDSMDSRFPENLTRTAHTHGTRVTSTILLSYCPQNHSSIYQPPTGTDMEECNTDTDVTDVFHKLSPAYVQELLQVFEFTYVRTKNFIDLSVFICICMNRKKVKDEG